MHIWTTTGNCVTMGCMKTAKSSITKRRILETAIGLFNEKGTTAVTTNHIAATLGISPGNLYYHFRNKEEIIREIFTLMEMESREGLSAIATNSEEMGMDVFEGTFGLIQRFNKRFGFFKKELPILVAKDPELQRRFLIVHKETLELITKLIEGAVKAGFLCALKPEEKSHLAEMAWMLSLFWPNYLAVTGETSEEGFERGMAIIRLLIDKFRADMG